MGYGNIGEGHGQGVKCKTSFIAIYISFSKALVRLDVQLTQDALLFYADVDSRRCDKTQTCFL